MTLLVSLADLRTHLNIASTTQASDAELTALEESATDILEATIGRPLRLVTITGEKHDGGPSIRLNAVPCACRPCQTTRVLTVTSVSVDGTTVSSGEYVLDSDLGKILRKPAITWTATDPLGIAVTYQAGYSAAPYWLVMAIKRLVEHLWKQTQQPRGGRPTAAAEASPTPGAAFLLPYAIQSLIDPHGHGGVLVA